MEKCLFSLNEEERVWENLKYFALKENFFIAFKPTRLCSGLPLLLLKETRSSVTCSAPQRFYTLHMYARFILSLGPGHRRCHVHATTSWSIKASLWAELCVGVNALWSQVYSGFIQHLPDHQGHTHPSSSSPLRWNIKTPSVRSHLGSLFALPSCFAHPNRHQKSLFLLIPLYFFELSSPKVKRRQSGSHSKGFTMICARAIGPIIIVKCIFS